MKIDINLEDIPLTENCYWCHGHKKISRFNFGTQKNVETPCDYCGETGTLITPFGQAILDHVATYGHLGKKQET